MLARLIRDIRDSGVTVVLIEHDASVVMRLSDGITVLDHGRTRRGLPGNDPRRRPSDRGVPRARQRGGHADGRSACCWARSALELQGLEVSYGAIAAVKGIDLGVDEGEVITLIGANGAGKSTSLKAIAGVVRPGRARSACSASA